MSLHILTPITHGLIPDGIPFAIDVVQVTMGAMVAGVKVTTVQSAFGKGKGEVLGVVSLVSKDTANAALAFSAATGSNAGEVDVTMNSTNNASTANITTTLLIFGRLLPVSV